MTVQEIEDYITIVFRESYAITSKDGDVFFFYGSESKFPFATIVVKDNEFDHVSNLDRKDFYRLNIGIEKDDFIEMFGEASLKKGIGGYLDSGIDFTEENRIMPHPMYGSMYWICIVNPDRDSFSSLMPQLTAAYQKAVEKENKQMSKEE